jgi:adenosylcobyric acid synthase
MRQNGLEAEILKKASRGTPVFGICGGLQMLGKTISDPYQTESGGEIAGMGLLPIDTVFAKEKTRTQTEGAFEKIEGIFDGLNGIAHRGYEIHMGQSDTTAAVVQNGNVYGSYIHGIFDENGIAETIIRALCEQRGLTFDENAVFDVHAYREAQYDKLADAVREALDMDLVYKILEEGV